MALSTTLVGTVYRVPAEHVRANMVEHILQRTVINILKQINATLLSTPPVPPAAIAATPPAGAQEEEKAMQNLWGEEERTPQPPKQRHPSHAQVTTVPLCATDCLLYGHTWRTTGMSGEKHCTVCHRQGYCPGCIPNPPAHNAQPVYCAKHTAAERSA